MQRKPGFDTDDRIGVFQGVDADTGRAAGPRRPRRLPDRIGKEPLVVAVRKGDEQWVDILRWVAFALVTTEELGVTWGLRRCNACLNRSGNPAPAGGLGRFRQNARPR